MTRLLLGMRSCGFQGRTALYIMVRVVAGGGLLVVREVGQQHKLQ
jgi:hypothetical protein